MDNALIKKRFETLSPHLDERLRRLLAAAEAVAIGRGGITTVSRETGLCREAIRIGCQELEDKTISSRIRKAGAGRKRTTDRDLTLITDSLVIYKYAAVLSSENHVKEKMVEHAKAKLREAHAAGFDVLLERHAKVWAHKWEECDITIDGDIAAQQGIRFNIFQLTQTYTGEDERLNIGPKGFTGE